MQSIFHCHPYIKPLNNYISTKIIFLTQAWTYVHLHTEKIGGLDQPSRSDTHWQIAHKRWSQMMRRAGIRMTHSHYALSLPWRKPEQHGQNVEKIALQFQALQGCLGVCEVQLIIIVLETAHIQTPDSTFPIQLQRSCIHNNIEYFWHAYWH